MQIGDVGYHKRPAGSFVRLFNAFDPAATGTSHHVSPLPPLRSVQIGTQTQQKRSAVLRGWDYFYDTFLRSAPIPPKSPTVIVEEGSGARPSTDKENPDVGGDKSKNVTRRYDFLLRAGHRRAMLVAESTTYVSRSYLSTMLLCHSRHFVLNSALHANPGLG